MRGGLGIVFPDANSFSNPGYFATVNGFSAEGRWRHIQMEGDNIVTPSAVLGNGAFGFGAYGQRFGKLDDVDLATDTVGAGAGVALVKEKLLFGVAFERSVEKVVQNDGTLTATLSLVPKGKGLSVVAAGSTTFNADEEVRTATLGVGYVISPMLALEAAVKANNVNDFEDLTGTAGFLLQAKYFYLGGRYSYNNLSELHGAEGRLGIVVADLFDASGYMQRTFNDAYALNYGASARFRF